MDDRWRRIAALCIVAVLWAVMLAGADMAALAAIGELDAPVWAEAPIMLASFVAAAWLWWLPVSNASRKL